MPELSEIVDARISETCDIRAMEIIERAMIEANKAEGLGPPDMTKILSLLVAANELRRLSKSYKSGLKRQ